MAATLLPLADHVPGLDIKMEMPKPFRLDDPERAHVLLRCTQEIITNAVRHAQAQTLWLCYYRQDGRMVRLHAHDDGRGAEAASAGNGLRGMRERLAAYGGRVDIVTARVAGFRWTSSCRWTMASRPRQPPALPAAIPFGDACPVEAWPPGHSQ